MASPPDGTYLRGGGAGAVGESSPADPSPAAEAGRAAVRVGDELSAFAPPPIGDRTLAESLLFVRGIACSPFKLPARPPPADCDNGDLIDDSEDERAGAGGR